MKITMHTRVPEDLHQALAAEADRLGISLNALVNIVLADWREKRSGS